MTSSPKPPPGFPGAGPLSPEPGPEARTTGPYRLLPEGAVPLTFSPERRFRVRAPEGVR
ncbi:hypothetical protein [Streptosporangium sp. NPDC001681]|uniref:hypothetical protein n=1 Tax=Streptosporangium sp. NPDC001681 TaxID=3154395 RepID=UPI00332F02C3